MGIKVGVIGAGGIATHHIRGYQQAGTPVIMMADAQADVARRRGEELGCAWTADYRELLARPDIDAVSICVPNWLHDVGPTDYFVEEIRDFTARVEAGQPPAITVDDGYCVDRIIDACYRSSEAGRRIDL